MTALHIAARLSTDLVVKTLIEAGAEVEAQDSVKDRPLHEAARCNSASVVAALIEAKADVNAQGVLQKTPLHKAADSALENRAAIIQLLLAAKAKVNVLDEEQHSSLFFAAENEHEQSVILLCQAGADPNLGINPLKDSSIDKSMKALIKKHSKA